MAHRHNRRDDRYRSGWEFENLVKLFFEIFIFAPFRLAKHNILPDDDMPVGNIVLDYLSCCVMFTILGMAKLWIPILILVILLVVPLMVRTGLYLAQRERTKIKNDLQQVETLEGNEHYVENKLSDQKIKLHRQEIVTQKEKEAPQIGFIAPDYNAMSDNQVKAIMQEHGIKLGHTKQRLVPKKQTQKVIETLPDFSQMDNETLRSWVSNNANQITVKSFK